jgi:endonuclease YncB( thermonuclease family)
MLFPEYYQASSHFITRRISMNILDGYSFKGTSLKASEKKLLRTSDGDTPQIEQPIRMVSCDTPEKSGYAGGPEICQSLLNKLADRLKNDFYNIDVNLKKYLLNKLDETAAERHINAGLQATMEFERLQEERLTKSSGKRRKIAVIPTGEVIDSYGRMLAYIAPWFSGEKADPIPPKDSPERRTFNLDMIENGWAAFFPIYPSLPQKDDFLLSINSAKEAWKNKKGAWKLFGENILLGYEFRMCIKLAKAKTESEGKKDAFQRVCINVVDMKKHGKYGFWEIEPCYRLWIWEKDIEKATIDLGIH